MIKIDEGTCIGRGMCARDCIALNIEVKDKKACPKRGIVFSADTVWRSVR